MDRLEHRLGAPAVDDCRFPGEARPRSLVRECLASGAYVVVFTFAANLRHASEFAANAILHSRPRGESFTIRVELHRDHLRVECRDSGGPWRSGRHDDRPHGLRIVEGLTGPDSWGVETTGNGNRIVWARLTW